uniref:ATP synthase F0 subunit 8 n=1 Tax=Taharana fasciana TaxID=2038276 RepID=A0A343K3X5_TAHFA|nr:ATP synthase F0 subunit 8 [Taharana fasciana]
MPQMSPSWWIIMLLITTSMNMYIMSIKFHNKENNTNKLNKKIMSIHWKW